MESMLIECDNLVAMKRLRRELEGKIDVMPIDPPYNTAVPYAGYRDGCFAGGWTEFMRPRLEIASRLLSPHGVMFINIDENEFCALWALCGEIFGPRNLMSMVWKKTDRRLDANRREKPLESGVRRTHEFVVVCFKDREGTVLNPIMQPVWDGQEYAERLRPMETVLDGMGTNASAKDELEGIFGERDVFRTPKPVKLIEEFVRAGSGKGSLVMDFFAGSGTSGEAVMRLNAEDGGSRRFVLINNGENGICRRVTLPRLQKAYEKYGGPGFLFAEWTS